MPEARRAHPGLPLFLLVVFFAAGAVAPAQAQPDPNLSTVSVGVGTLGTRVTPNGTAPALAMPGSELIVIVRDALGQPITGLQPSDFEVDGFPASTMSDAFFPATGAHNVVLAREVLPGDYILDGQLYSGGCGTQMFVRVQGVTINSGQSVTNPFVSLDLTGPGGLPDGLVNILDLAQGTSRIVAALGGIGTDPCVDLNFDGVVNLSDLGLYAAILVAEYTTTFPTGATLDVD